MKLKENTRKFKKRNLIQRRYACIHETTGVIRICHPSCWNRFLTLMISALSGRSQKGSTHCCRKAMRMSEPQLLEALEDVMMKTMKIIILEKNSMSMFGKLHMTLFILKLDDLWAKMFDLI